VRPDYNPDSGYYYRRPYRDDYSPYRYRSDHRGDGYFYPR
jgi:hypothetical protein